MIAPYLLQQSVYRWPTLTTFAGQRPSQSQHAGNPVTTPVITLPCNVTVRLNAMQKYSSSIAISSISIAIAMVTFL
mgnify:CR=1 FL=1